VAPPPPRRRIGIQGVVGIAIGAFFLSRHHSIVGSIALTLGSLSVLLAILAPAAWILTVHHWMERFTEGIGKGVTVVVLSLVYFLFFLPVGVLSRGKATARFQRLLDPKATTYWRPRTAGASQSERQF
jgi:hypothetical protein